MSTILQCDKCSKVPATRFVIPVESYTDNAGSSDTRCITLDLCDHCIREWFRKLLNVVSMKGAQTRDVVEEFTGKRPEAV